MHSADGKIPSGFITISLVSLRSPSLQAYYWKKCCFNKEQFQGWSTATNHRLGSLIYKSLVSERDAAECQVFTLLKALYDPLDQTPAAPGQRRIQGCLGKDPACISTGEVHVCVYIDARSQRRRVWIRGIRTKHVSQRCRSITSKYVESGHVTRSRIQSGRFRFASRPWNARALLHFAAKQIMSNPRALRLLSGPGPGAGKQQRARPSAPV